MRILHCAVTVVCCFCLHCKWRIQPPFVAERPWTRTASTAQPHRFYYQILIQSSDAKGRTMWATLELLQFECPGQTALHKPMLALPKTSGLFSEDSCFQTFANRSLHCGPPQVSDDTQRSLSSPGSKQEPWQSCLFIFKKRVTFEVQPKHLHAFAVYCLLMANGDCEVFALLCHRAHEGSSRFKSTSISDWRSPLSKSTKFNSKSSLVQRDERPWGTMLRSYARRGEYTPCITWWPRLSQGKHLLCPGEKAAHRTQALCPSRVRMPPKVIQYHTIGPCAILRCDTESDNFQSHWFKHLPRNISGARHIPRCQPARPQSLKSLGANNARAWGHGLWPSHLLKRWQSQETQSRT